MVATVLTVYGIETYFLATMLKTSASLQQYLPFTVLKPEALLQVTKFIRQLQQYLPFTVLKLGGIVIGIITALDVATVLTVYGIETMN